MNRFPTISLLCGILALCPASMASLPDASVLHARSFEAATTEAEAIELARRDAADALLPRLRDVTRVRINERPSRRTVLPNVMPSDNVLRRVIRAELAGDALIRERRIERQSRPYGDVYAATLTIDTSTTALHRMAQRAIDLRGASIRSVAGVVTVAGVALTGICLAYLAANSLTRGYYQGRLRLLATTASLASAGAAAMIVYGIAA